MLLLRLSFFLRIVALQCFILFSCRADLHASFHHELPLLCPREHRAERLRIASVRSSLLVCQVKWRLKIGGVGKSDQFLWREDIEINRCPEL